MPIFEITTIDIFRKRYVIEAETIDDACESVLMDQPEELSQTHLDENIIDVRAISKKGFAKLIRKVEKETYEEHGLDNAHLGEKIIHRVNN
jgi:hypothetical protein